MQCDFYTEYMNNSIESYSILMVKMAQQNISKGSIGEAYTEFKERIHLLLKVNGSSVSVIKKYASQDPKIDTLFRYIMSDSQDKAIEDSLSRQFSRQDCDIILDKHTPKSTKTVKIFESSPSDNFIQRSLSFKRKKIESHIRSAKKFTYKSSATHSYTSSKLLESIKSNLIKPANAYSCIPKTREDANVNSETQPPTYSGDILALSTPVNNNTMD
jgi:hypothetical protein